MSGRPELKCKLYPFGSQEDLKYVVVCSFYEGTILLSRHKKRSTWETQGGHIEAGESPLDAAKRELFEESGVKDADLYPLCDYLGYDDTGSSMGAVFLAEIHQLGTLPDSEMQETGLFPTLPDDLTYPNVTPRLFDRAAQLLRVLHMERALNIAAPAVHQLAEALEAYAAVQPQLQNLSAYMDSGNWRLDYEADEGGLFPRDLRRGVLSQDRLYDLLTENQRLGILLTTFCKSRDSYDL